MNVLVIGGAGFIGSHLVDRLLAEGHRVDAVDNLSSGALHNLGDARGAAGLTIHTLDAASVEFAELLRIRRPDAVVHLGWLAPGTSCSPAASGAALASMLNVLEAARLQGATKVVTALSAVAAYGDVAPRDLPIKEAQPWSPVGVRGVVSRSIVDLLTHYRLTHGVEFCALALGNVYGSRQRSAGGVVATMQAAHRSGQPVTVHGDGRQTRDFLFIDDCVDALAKAVVRGDGLVINVGTGVATSVGDLARMIAGERAAVVSEPGRPADPTRCALGGTRARIQLAWAPWTQLSDGLRQLDRAEPQ